MNKIVLMQAEAGRPLTGGKDSAPSLRPIFERNQRPKRKDHNQRQLDKSDALLAPDSACGPHGEQPAIAATTFEIAGSVINAATAATPAAPSDRSAVSFSENFTVQAGKE
jgi:hypothetical protein